eukprot:11004618-Ditylum_brightwellii.AAC.1
MDELVDAFDLPSHIKLEENICDECLALIDKSVPGKVIEAIIMSESNLDWTQISVMRKRGKVDLGQVSCWKIRRKRKIPKNSQGG